MHLAAGAAALPAMSRIARAQAYPSRPVRIIVEIMMLRFARTKQEHDNFYRTIEYPKQGFVL